jgi:hypothetical protein
MPKFNAVFLTSSLVFEKKVILIDSVAPWKFSAWAHRFSRLDEYFSSIYYYISKMKNM